MSWGPIISAGIGALGSFLGGGQKTNPYAGQIQDQADYLAKLRAQQGEAQENAQSGVDQFDPAYRTAVTSEANLLGTDPFTDQYSTEVLGKATEGTNAAYAGASAAAAQDLARRGLSGGSLDRGTPESLRAAQAGEIANAQNNLAQEKISSADSRAAALTGLLGGVSGGYRNAAAGGLNSEVGTTGDISNIYQNLNAAGNQVAEENNRNLSTAIGGAAGAIGTAIGGAGGGGAGADYVGDPTSQNISDTYSLSNGDTPAPNLSSGMPEFDPNTGAPLSRAQPVNPSMAFLPGIVKARRSYGLGV